MPITHTIKRKNGTKQVVLTPLAAIKEKCLDCTCWQFKEVKLCPIHDCALYPYRFGTDPCRAGKGKADNLRGACASKNTPTQVAEFSGCFESPSDGMGAIGLH